MKPNPIILGALFGGTAVIAGAFGAHALKAVLSADQLLSFNTAVRYQMWHAVVLLLIDFIPLAQKTKNALFWLFGLGVILFSGSIYLLNLSPLFNGVKWSFLGPITPVGGILLITGWIVLLLSQLKKRKEYTK